MVLSAALAMAKTSIHEWDDPIPLFAPAGDVEPEPDAVSEPEGEAVEEAVELDEEAEIPLDEGAEAALDEEAAVELDEEEAVTLEDEEGAALEEEPESVVEEKPGIVLDEKSVVALAEEPESVMDRIRIEAGVRCLGVWLTQDRKGEQGRGSFIGSIYKLKARQNWAPIHPYVQVTYALDSGWRLGGGLTYSHVEIQTLDSGGGDGDVECDAFMAYLLAERDFGRFRPYVEAGGGISRNEFDPIPSWSAHNMRQFLLDDSPAFFGGGGCSVGLAWGLSLDAHVRYVHCDVDGTYIFQKKLSSARDFTFTTSYVAAGVGLSYAF